MQTNFEISDFHKQRILVVGLGLTGKSVLRYLQRCGVAFELADEGMDELRLQEFNREFGDLNVPLHSQFSESLFRQFDLLVVSPGIPQSHAALLAARRAGVSIIGDIDLFIDANRADVIAVTGSNGKSTVVAWIGHILKSSPLAADVAGNIGTPALDVLDELLDVVVLELSSFQLETSATLNALSATVLNVSEDHMDRYPDFAHYAAAKRRIHKGCSHLIVNACDQQTWPAPVLEQSAKTAGLTDLADTSSVSSFSLEPATQSELDGVCSHHVAEHEGEAWLVIDSEPFMPTSEIKLAGKHNLENALAVIALLAPLRLSGTLLRAGLSSFTGLRHRTQLVAEINRVRWYNDSKGTNVDACARAISGMASPVVLIAGGIGKGADFSVLQESVQAHVNHLVLIGRDAPLLESALTGLATVHHARSMREAVELAAQLATAGDVVLLSPACSSFDMFSSFEHRGDVFCEEVLRLAA